MSPEEKLARELEAFETPVWTVESILDVEILTQKVVDPCTGYFVIADAAERHGYDVETIDIHQWSDERSPNLIKDFLTHVDDLTDKTVLMNSPFSKACEFIDHARILNARKIVCFQRFAWRESVERKQWWSDNPPARIWVCGNRATCKRFDIRDQSMSSSVAYAWFVWERGHKGAEVVQGLYR